ncbi:hypothetical protein TSUD_204320 [Trifolium subterraneum]|uniref:RNA helicase n=1 Tax=Trifolium subterraneum TaxID=3900 RepID=A0A2Z6NL23_TRISU|nr:hypothetical protein TSUD_204320 [Trifolium subterraneum]
MPPKRNQKQSRKPQSSSSSSSSAPKLQISAENENRIRRLLLNSARPTPATDDTLTKDQKAKKLKTVYEKLSCEGFTDHHIELALSALKVCVCISTSRGSVGVILNHQDSSTPSVDPSITTKDQALESPVLIKRQLNDDTLDSCQSSQADWIRQYVEQQEEDENKTWEDDIFDESSATKLREPRPYDVIAKEYLAARLEATKAKEKKDRKHQEQASRIIRKLKQELSALGLSDDTLALEYEQISTKQASEGASMGHEPLIEKEPRDVESNSAIILPSNGAAIKSSDVENHSADENLAKSCLLAVHVEKDSAQEVAGDIELGGFFLEDMPSNDIHPDILKAQKLEKIKRLSEKNLDKLDGIWKKGDPQKVPKAILHQLCQKSGWDAPKFNKILGRGKSFSYTVSILRKASGRGKNRKAGGLVTLKLPDQNEAFESAEDAQNKVAAYALFQLFPDFPFHLLITEPYASVVMKWMEGESLTKLEDSVEDHKSRFVESLLSGDGSGETASTDVVDYRFPQNNGRIDENKSSTIDSHQSSAQRGTYSKELESTNLRQAQHIKMGTQRYQVPQFILDEMIESGHGGHCNIICTQPRRIAAISVAERVADERCEPSPGSDGSLIGYQVRLDSARNEKTRLLFCTTGILLRKLMGNRSLTGITHIIVDEVHERSLLGDFILIVLKNLIEKQSSESSSKVKVILMSATVDSSSFSRYFGHCPVVTAEGRTHPVTTYFLEDIYDQINYRLASDSPASLTYETFPEGQRAHVTNNRGKKNLVLSAWGDESMLSEEHFNPYFDLSYYQSYSEQAQKNLKRVNEDVIDYDLIEDLICYIDESCGEGAILVFLPGVFEINHLHDKLAASYQFGGPSSDWIIPLHSSVASTEQKKVFLRPPGNIRKVVIATNIAETSITIDDVIYVIDCGKHKENRYNPQKKLSSMVEDWISQANARQRQGRAGRVKPGICFRLYTRYRFEKLMRPYQVPEMLRMPLVELCLQIKLLSLGYIKPFLSMVGALEGDEELTPLGYHLAKLPVDVLIGKMMVYGAIFGCLSPILSVSAFLSYKSPFVYPKDERQNVERAKLTLLNDKQDGPGDGNDIDRQSDHLLMMIAYKRWGTILNEMGLHMKQPYK